MKILYISRPEDTNYRDMTYTPDSWMLENSVPFVEKSEYDASIQKQIELTETLHAVIDHGVPGAFYEGSAEYKLRQKYDTALERIQQLEKALIKAKEYLDPYERPFSIECIEKLERGE